MAFDKTMWIISFHASPLQTVTALYNSICIAIFSTFVGLVVAVVILILQQPPLELSMLMMMLVNGGRKNGRALQLQLQRTGHEKWNDGKTILLGRPDIG